MTLKVELLGGSTPRLPGALCRGQWSLFDPSGDGEGRVSVAARHERAVALCGRCPALADCREWIAAEPPRFRQGVIGGTAYYRTAPKEQDQ